MLSLVENVRKKHLNWVQAILEARHWNASQLAEAADIDQSTLSKFLNDRTGTAQLSSRTIEKLALAGRIPPFHASTATGTRWSAPGMAEAEATPYAPASSDPLSSAIRTFIDARNGLDPWQLKGRALELAGYLPGDILMVDMNASPQDGDIICVQIYDRQGQAETAFRIYEHPYLVAATQDPHLRRPILLDNDRATARGVVMASFRPRQNRAA